MPLNGGIMKKFIVLISLLITSQSHAEGITPDCKWSKNPNCWDTSKPNYQLRVCPAEYNSRIIVIGVKNSGAAKTCSAYTINEYEITTRNASARIRPMEFDCSRTSITFGTILNAEISYRPFMMNNGEVSCSRYLKGISHLY